MKYNKGLALMKISGSFKKCSEILNMKKQYLPSSNYIFLKKFLNNNTYIRNIDFVDKTID